MVKVIEFYLRGPLAKKVKPIPIERAYDKLTLIDFTSGTINQFARRTSDCPLPTPQHIPG